MCILSLNKPLMTLSGIVDFCRLRSSRRCVRCSLRRLSSSYFPNQVLIVSLAQGCVFRRCLYSLCTDETRFSVLRIWQCEFFYGSALISHNIYVYAQ